MTDNFSEKDEIYLLGGCMDDPAILGDCIEKLSASAFFIKEHHGLFKILRQMFRLKIQTNPSMVIKYIEDNDLVAEVSDLKLIHNISLLGDRTIDANYYIRRIQSFHSKRSLQKIGEDILTNISTSKDPEILKNEIIERLQDLDAANIKGFTSNRQVFENFKDGMNYIQYLDDLIEKKSKGIDIFEGFRTGYPQLDSLIGGFENGTSTIIGARSSSGKTTFIVNLILNIFRENPTANIGFFSFEMNKRRIFEKILYTYAGVRYSNDKNHIYSQEEYQSLVHHLTDFKSWPLFHFDHSGIKISQLKSEVKKAISRHKMNICFIDYLTKIQGDFRGQNKHIEIDQVSKGIQECAQEFNIPFVTLAQLNRQAIGRTDKRPTMTDLRESGSIEEDADTILMLHRPKHFDTSLKEDNTELYVSKNRSYGDLGKIVLKFDRGILAELPSVENLVQGAMISPQEEKENTRAWEKTYVAREY